MLCIYCGRKKREDTVQKSAKKAPLDGEAWRDHKSSQFCWCAEGFRSTRFRKRKFVCVFLTVREPNVLSAVEDEEFWQAFGGSRESRFELVLDKTGKTLSERLCTWNQSGPPRRVSFSWRINWLDNSLMVEFAHLFCVNGYGLKAQRTIRADTSAYVRV